ncbi:GNAT family N-acetyltransferase [Aminipila sp.]|uniref:GNAT family N-acetyltransferase n=1 Tax=Aminipila sp. TaxID=2060095 RepID=UPI00289C0448|nr:GNAT family N-acetyltransferase [Aminipila sp.]
MEIRELSLDEFNEAFRLARMVFQEFEAPDYSEEGIQTFSNFLNEPSYTAILKIYGAFDNKQLVGILATRSEGDHIALFFVDGKYHRRGVGRQLFEKACLDNMSGKITVNSSPYAQEIYRHLGFTETDKEQITDGLRYIPMICILELRDQHMIPHNS